MDILTNALSDMYPVYREATYRPHTVWLKSNVMFSQPTAFNEAMTRLWGSVQGTLGVGVRQVGYVHYEV